MEPKANRD